ncbi:MAG: MptD family putative ECF transporter S component [Lachnospiraceae bacterium]|nr:MptD family putative ECF transporter S component [Lachnospiraceae bacterium]
MNGNKKLKVKDIITVVLLAMINVVLFFASFLLYVTPYTIMLMPVFFSLLEGIVYFMIGTKVRKPGAILVYSIVRSILGGCLPYILLILAAGVLVTSFLGACIGKRVVRKHLAAIDSEGVVA